MRAQSSKALFGDSGKGPSPDVGRDRATEPAAVSELPFPLRGEGIGMGGR